MWSRLNWRLISAAIFGSILKLSSLPRLAMILEIKKQSSKAFSELSFSFSKRIIKFEMRSDVMENSLKSTSLFESCSLARWTTSSAASTEIAIYIGYGFVKEDAMSWWTQLMEAASHWVFLVCRSSVRGSLCSRDFESEQSKYVFM